MERSNLYDYKNFKQIVRSTRKKKPTKVTIASGAIIYKVSSGLNTNTPYIFKNSYWSSIKVNTANGEFHEHRLGFSALDDSVSYLFEFLRYGILKSPYEPA